MRQLLCPRVVGRDEELAVIAATIEAARNGRGQTLFVIGEAGVGKSRLALEAENHAVARGLWTLRGRCVEGGPGGTSAATVTCRPIAEALLSALRRHAASGARAWDRAELRPFRHILSRLIPDWREPDQPPAEDSLVLLAEAVLRVLRALASTAPQRGCLLVLEDLHWADAETNAVLEYLAANIASEGIAILATSRPEPHSPSLALVRSLAARRLGRGLDLERLSPDAVREMASACLDDAPLPDPIDHLLSASADGLPLLVEDLLAAWASAGAMVKAEGGWQVRQLPRPLVPLSFSETVRRRLRQLGDDATRLLRLAALLGRRFDWTLLPPAAAMDEDRVLELLHAAVDAQLVLAEPSAFVFRHALTRDAVLAELLPAERARQAARLLDLIEASHSLCEDDWCELAADLALAAGNRVKAATLLLESGQRLLARGALTSADAMLERARSLIPRDAELELQAEIDRALLGVLVDAGKNERAVEVGRGLLATLSRSNAESGRAAEVHLMLATAAAAASDQAQASGHLETARSLDRDGVLEARLDALAARVAIDERRSADADHLARAALAAAERRGEIEVACDALIVIGRLARTRDLESAETAFDRARQLAEMHHLTVWRGRALHELGTVDMFRDAAPERLLEARALALDAGALETAAWVDGELAALFNTRFEMERSFEFARSALDAGRRYHLPGVVAMALLFEAEVYAYRLDRSTLEQTLAELARTCGDDAFFTIGAWECRAIVSLLDEDRPRAVRELENAVELSRSLPVAAPSPTLALWALNRTLDEPEVTDPREVLRGSSSMVNFTNAGYAAYAEAIALGRQGRTVAAAGAVRAGDDLLAPAPWYHQYGRRLVAEAAVRDGWGEPSTWLGQAEAFFGRHDYPAVASACRSLLRKTGATIPRPAARRRVPEPFRSRGVTERELEVLVILADGLSNKLIASRLYLSPKTVEKHVASLMDKLDVRTRASLATIATANLGDAATRKWGKSSM
jgi:DNA-binding CsgD family transcriptional regulator